MIMRSFAFWTLLICVSAGMVGCSRSGASGDSAALLSVVDTQFVLRNAQAAKAAAVQIDRMRNDYEASMIGRRNDLEKQARELAAARAEMDADAYSQRVRTITNQLDALGKEAEAREQAFDSASSDASLKIGTTIIGIVDEIRAERQIPAVLDRSSVVGNMSLPDITPEVVRRLDQKMPALAISVPAAAPK